MPGPQQIRQQQQHEQKLKDIHRLVALGTLVVRPMTDEERERYPPLPPDAPRRRRDRRA